MIEVNRNYQSLQKIRDKALASSQTWKVNDQGLLTYQNWLVVPAAHFVRTHLIRAVHATQITAHPSKRKTTKLLQDQYYWPGMAKDVDTYVAACKACRWSHVPRDRTPGLLKSLPIPERAWQDVSIGTQGHHVLIPRCLARNNHSSELAALGASQSHLT